MNNYSYRIENENNEIVLWIDINGYPLVRQPHHPQSYMSAPWSNENEAAIWAEEFIKNKKIEEVGQEIEKTQKEADDALDRAYKQAVILQTLGGAS